MATGSAAGARWRAQSWRGCDCRRVAAGPVAGTRWRGHARRRARLHAGARRERDGSRAMEGSLVARAWLQAHDCGLDGWHTVAESRAEAGSVAVRRVAASLHTARARPQAQWQARGGGLARGTCVVTGALLRARCLAHSGGVARGGDLGYRQARGTSAVTGSTAGARWRALLRRGHGCRCGDAGLTASARWQSSPIFNRSSVMEDPQEEEDERG